MNCKSNIVIGTVGLALIVGLALSSMFFYREALQAREMAQQSRAEAEMQRERTEAVTQFLNAALTAADPQDSGRDATTVRDVLDHAAAEAGAALAEQPRVEASVRAAIGRSYLELGETGKAAAELATACEISVRELGVHHPETRAIANLLIETYERLRRQDDAEAVRELLDNS